MPADFLSNLNANIADFEQAINGRQKTGRRNKFGGDPARLAAWESARHTERLPRAAETATNNPAPPAPAPQ